jgi:hypothetical protein
MMIFLHACEGNLAPLKSLLEANNTAFRAALALYRQERDKGERAADVSTFFKRKAFCQSLNDTWDAEVRTSNGRLTDGGSASKRDERLSGPSINGLGIRS